MVFPWEQEPPSIELLREPAGDGRLAEELVTLELQPSGDLVLRALAIGIAIELLEGEGRTKRISRYIVGAAQVPRVLRAALRDLIADTAALRDWMASRGVEAVADQWHGYGVRPQGEERFLLEALRDVIGKDDDFDEGEKVAYRFGRWLSRHGIDYEFREEVGEAY